jgi:threonine synthase
MYVPANEEDLKPWILYMNETTTFQGIAGTLTSALLKEELSPVVSERIAAKAFPFSPKLKKLSSRLYSLELYHGPTGADGDFGISYLASCLEHILIMQDREAVIISAVSDDTPGVCVATALRDKKKLKAILLYPKGTMKGLNEQDFVWNGGNVYPVEVNGSVEDCYRMMREIYADRSLVSEYGLTLANTVNIGRLLPQTFFYMYAFAQLKKHVVGDIYYAMAARNYGNLVAGLYGWKFSLPVNGFITDSSAALTIDAAGRSLLLDSVIPIKNRASADPVTPSNLERLEEVFAAYPAIMRSMVFPAEVTAAKQAAAVKEVFVKYGELISPHTASAYAAAKARQDLTDDESGGVVLISRTHPAFDAQTIKMLCGEELEVPDHIRKLYEPVTPKYRIEAEVSAVQDILNQLRH